MSPLVRKLAIDSNFCQLAAQIKTSVDATWQCYSHEPQICVICSPDQIWLAYNKVAHLAMQFGHESTRDNLYGITGIVCPPNVQILPLYVTINLFCLSTTKVLDIIYKRYANTSRQPICIKNFMNEFNHASQALTIRKHSKNQRSFDIYQIVRLGCFIS